MVVEYNWKSSLVDVVLDVVFHVSFGLVKMGRLASPFRILNPRQLTYLEMMLCSSMCIEHPCSQLIVVCSYRVPFLPDWRNTFVKLE